ncbi:MAG: DUF1080 domain-containing protein [Armatimonadota bacterium]
MILVPTPGAPPGGAPPPLATPVESLFNGRDLAGWTLDVPELDRNPAGPRPFVVRGGRLVSLGKPGGHLITDRRFADYRLVAEYRFAGRPGNCGILVHASTPRRLYKMFPQSIEVQLQHRNAGDFWCIGEDISVPDMEARRGPKASWGVDEGKGRRIANLTDRSERFPGDWNTVVVECRADRITVWVNGDLVNDGTGATARSGRIAVQAEGAEVEFKRIELQPLEPAR